MNRVIRTTPNKLSAEHSAESTSVRPFRWARATVLALSALGATALVPTTAQAETLAERLALCAGCHGEDGNSPVPDYPKLSGPHFGHPIIAIFGPLPDHFRPGIKS